MDVETIKAFGQYIVMPICAVGVVAIFFYFLTKE